MKKLLFILLAGLASVSYAGTRLMITYKPSPQEQKLLNSASHTNQLQARQTLMQPLTKIKLTRLENEIQHKFKDINYLATGGRVIELDSNYSAIEVNNIIARLKSDPEIRSVEEDILLYPAVFETSRYQWGTFDITSNVPNQNPSIYYGDNFYDSLTNNNPNTTLLGNNGQGIVVAVLDTGYVPHPNFISQLSAYPNTQMSGYTFISNCRIAGTCPPSQTNDTINYFVNALDLGDYMTQNEINQSNGFFNGCQIMPSSWHGTHVTGTIAAQGSSVPSISTMGILGGAYKATILPVRVLGKCGGYFSDIVNAMLWASGVSTVQSIPLPEHSARIINMSLGASGTCDSTMQSAVNAIVDNGGIVVAAAGNQSANLSGFIPASCNNVISVAAVSPSNKLTRYSNWGNATIAAAGGDLDLHNGGILSTMYNSATTFSACSGSSCYTYAQYQGTSMATPSVVALIADMLSINPDLDYTAVRDILLDSSESFDTCYTLSKCVNTGRINARNAVAYAVTNIPTLDSDVNSIEFSEESGILTQNIIVENKESIPITIGHIGFAGENSNSFKINSTTCESSLVLAQNQSCMISISPISSTSQNQIGIFNSTLITAVADFEVYNIHDYRVLYIPVSYSYNYTPPEPQPTSSPTPEPTVSPTPTIAPSPAPLVPTSGGGGGCTMINNGSDFGLLIFLALMWLYRRHKYRKYHE